MTLNSQRYAGSFVGVDGAPVYQADCSNTATLGDKRYVGKLIGVDGAPVFAVARCDFPELGRYPMRFVGVDGAPVFSIGCCSGCETVPLSSLPTITKSGWTATPWSSNPCCRRMELLPNTEADWIECCSDYFAEQTLTTSSTETMYAIRMEKPKQFAHPGPGTLTVDHCCTEGLGLGSIDSEIIRTRKFRLLAGVRLGKIDVTISRQAVTCDGVTNVKWIVTSRYYYQWQAWASKTFLVSGTRTASLNPDHAACTAITSVGGSASCENIGPCSLADIVLDGPGVGDTSNAVMISGGLSYFTRIKFFDSLETGTVAFGDTDVRDMTCSWPFCNEEEHYDLEFCAAVSSLPAMVEDCFCNKSQTADTVTTVYDVISSCCGRNCPLIFTNPIATQVTYCTPGDPDSYNPGCILGCAVETCESYSRVSLALDQPNPWVPDCASVFWAEELFNAALLCPSFSLPVAAIGLKDCATAPGCYWGDFCAPDPCGWPKIGFPASVPTGGSTSTACSFAMQMCCFAAPSWDMYFDME